MIPRIELPRTRAGWRKLFWLALYRCPKHRERLEPIAGTRVGRCVNGVTRWPRGLWAALRCNRDGGPYLDHESYP